MSDVQRPVFVVPHDAVEAMGRHALECFPEECCGLLVGVRDENRAVKFVPLTNVAHSARVYSLDAREHLHTELAAEAEGLEVIGVVHSHTHTEAWPSPTDVAQAVDPGWHYVIVTLARNSPEPRSFLINGTTITEEDIIPR
jgi:proteasome lid subunit RPN8/RPN11